MAENCIIEVQDLHFAYENELEPEKPAHQVLKGVNLQIRRGEFVAVLGHNGSGKSTLAKHLNAILQPTSGKVLVEGMDTSDPELLFDIRQHVGMVFQNPDNQIVATIVEEDVAFAPENLGVPREEMRKRVDDALKAVHMYEYRHHAPTSCPEDRSSGSPLPVSLPCGRTVSCWTSPPLCWIPTAGGRSCAPSGV